MGNYLSRYDADTLPTFEQCVQLDGEQVIFTVAGIARYKERFARAGIAIANIKTTDDLDYAMRASWHVEVAAMESLLQERLAHSQNAVESGALLAVMRGDVKQSERLIEKLERRKRVGLRLASNAKKRAG